jgi:hypothetical protein
MSAHAAAIEAQTDPAENELLPGMMCSLSAETP